MITLLRDALSQMVSKGRTKSDDNIVEERTHADGGLETHSVRWWVSDALSQMITLLRDALNQMVGE